MTIPTCAVTAIVQSGGAMAAGARVSARLNRYEVYQGYVVPQLVRGVTGVDGRCTVNLWPNALGSTASWYDVTIEPPAGPPLKMRAVVPNAAAVLLHEIADLPAYEGKPDGHLSAGAAAVSAAAAHDDRVLAETARSGAEQAADDADAYKFAAAQSEGLAAQHKQAAQDAATEAKSYATAAATSEANAAASAAAVAAITVVMPAPNGSDDTAAWNATIAAMPAAGGEVVVRANAASYRLSGRIVHRSNVAIRGLGYPVVNASTGGVTLFDLTGCLRAKVLGLNIQSDGLGTGRTFDLSNALDCEVHDNTIVNMPAASNGGIYLFGSVGATKNRITWNRISDSKGTAIGLIGGQCYDNTVADNKIENSGGFGVFVAGGANRNLVRGNSTHSNAIELVGVTAGSNYNRIIGNHAERCGDNGISVTGSHNTVVGNTCRYNDLSGVFLYGSHNTCVGNTCVGNNRSGTTSAGITVQAVFGGCGQHNTIVGNTLDDDQAAPTQTHGVRILDMTTAYAAWTSGEAVGASAYRYSGLNLYKSAAAGACGTAAPVHTSGTVSDGSVSWQFMASFETTVGTAYNTLGANAYGRAVSGAFYIQSLASQRIDTLQAMPDTLALAAATAMTFAVNGSTPLKLLRNTVQFEGSIARKRTGTASNLTAGESNDIIAVTSTAAPRTITLPSSGRYTGLEYTITDESGGAATNNITIAGNGANIDGAPSYVISSNYGKVTVYWTGTAWKTK